MQNLDKEFEGYTRDHDRHPIEFNGDEITLILPEKPVNNWRIVALSYPMVYNFNATSYNYNYEATN